MKLSLRSLTFWVPLMVLLTTGFWIFPLPAQKLDYRKIAEGLFVVPDACNVYVIKRGERAILIDSGEGRVLDLAKGLGIKTFDWVLHTHSHRDQCAATQVLAADGTRVAVPEGEVRFFEDVSSYWNDFDIYIRYIYKPDTFKPRENIRVDRKLSDGEVFEWEDVRIEVVGTPGHTLGAASYIIEIDGTRYAFTGDMIHSAGKVWNLYSFDHRYWDGGFTGIAKDLEGLDKLLSKNVNVFLPSHGEPIEDPAYAVSLLRKRLEAIYDFGPEPEERNGGEPSKRWRKVTEHLYYYRPTGYILLSDDSSALFYDYYAVPGRSDGRYSYESVEEVVKALGIKRVEVVIPSHFHEDHIRGIPSLRERFGTKVWVYENMADILAHPERYNLCCLAPEKIPADRILHDGERIRWKEYEFTVMHFPGQTMYHQAMAGSVDGRKVFFMGDTDCYEVDDPALIRRSLRLHGISTFLNYYLLEPGMGYEKAMGRLVEFDPELLLFAHSGARPGNLEMYMKNLETVRGRRELVAAVLPYADPNIGFDPNWAYFYPYTKKISPGGSFEAEVRVRNHLPELSDVKIELCLPEGWRSEPAGKVLKVAGKGEESASFRVSVPPNVPRGKRKVVTARILTDGHNWGEFCEMLVELD